MKAIAGVNQAEASEGTEAPALAVPQVAPTRGASAHAELGVQAPTSGTRAVPSVGAGQVALAFLWIGLMPTGGKSFALAFDEFVRRRAWLGTEQFIELQTLARLLPGPKGTNLVLILANVLRGPRAAVLSLALYTLPGFLSMFGLAVFAFSAEQPAWVQGALGGIAAGGIGLLLAMTVRMLPGARQGRFGAGFAGLAFVAAGVLGLDLLVVLLGLGLVALYANRPRE